WWNSEDHVMIDISIAHNEHVIPHPPCPIYSNSSEERMQEIWISSNYSEQISHVKDMLEALINSNDHHPSSPLNLTVEQVNDVIESLLNPRETTQCSSRMSSSSLILIALLIFSMLSGAVWSIIKLREIIRHRYLRAHEDRRSVDEPMLLRDWPPANNDNLIDRID
ncbi:hypothetical protein PENTCL1PPCAC_19719, partial [Pristionchus entomophagus]